MKSAIQADDAMDARALVLAGLEVDSKFDESATVEGYPLQTGSTLLHWAAANDALECTEVCDVISTVLHLVTLKRLSVHALRICMPVQQ